MGVGRDPPPGQSSGTILRPEGGGGADMLPPPTPLAGACLLPTPPASFALEAFKVLGEDFSGRAGSVLWQLPQFSYGHSNGWPQT